MENINKCTKSFHLKGLDCPQCSARIEAQTAEIDGVVSSNVDLMNQMLTLVVDGSRSDAPPLEEEIKKTVRRLSPDIEVLPAGINRTTVRPAFSESNEEISPAGRIIMICAGAAAFATGIAADYLFGFDGVVVIAIFAASCFITGYSVFLNGFWELSDGKLLGENFLASASVIAAFCVGRAPEAAAAMLICRFTAFFRHMLSKRFFDENDGMPGGEKGEVSEAEYSAAKLSARLTAVIAVSAVVISVIFPLMTGGDWTEWIGRGCVLLAISGSSAVVLSAAASFSGGIGAARRRGVLVKKRKHFGILGNMGIVVLDESALKDQDDRTAAISALKAIGTDKIVVFSKESCDKSENRAPITGIDECCSVRGPGEEEAAVDKLMNSRLIRERGRKLVFVADASRGGSAAAGADAGVLVRHEGAGTAGGDADIIITTGKLSALAEAAAVAKVAERTVNHNIYIFFGIKMLLFVMGIFGIVSMWMAVLADGAAAAVTAANSAGIYKM